MARRLKKVPPPLRMGKIEARYGANITTLLEPFKEAVESALFPMLDYITQSRPVRHDAAGSRRTLPVWCRGGAGAVPGWRTDAAGDDIRKVFEKIRINHERTFSQKKIEQVARNNAEMVDTQNHKTFRKQTKTVLGVDPIFAEPWLADETEAFVHENASLIKSISTEHLSDVEQMVFREARKGASPAEIKKKIQEIFKLADNQAALISRDQVAKYNGRLSELRQTAAGVTHYIWRTSDDGRVRTLANSSGYSSHGALDDKRFAWANPPVTVFKGKRGGETNHPGQDINCRCYAEPDLTKLAGGKEKKPEQETGVVLTGLSGVQQYEKILSTTTKKQQKVINDLPKPQKITNKKNAGIYRRIGTENELIADPEHAGGDTVIHEYGHHIDYQISILQKGHGLQGISQQDEGFLEAYASDRKRMGLHTHKTRSPKLKELAGQWLDVEIKTLKSGNTMTKTKAKRPELGLISDIVDAMTGGSFSQDHSAPGHGVSYFSKKGSRQTETFANLFALRNKEEWGNVKELFPSLTKRFDEIISEVEV